jgi:hypothetical protein
MSDHSTTTPPLMEFAREWLPLLACTIVDADDDDFGGFLPDRAKNFRSNGALRAGLKKLSRVFLKPPGGGV